MVENAANTIPAVLLLGGKGTRLSPLTDYTTKSLLPVYDKPLALHSLDLLEKSGVNKIIAVSSPNDIDCIARLFDDNKRESTFIMYVIQEKPLGTANAILYAKKHITENSFYSLWSDNVFEFNLFSSVGNELKSKCRIHLTRVKNPQDFGVVEIDSKKRIVSISDKPKVPKSNIICTGFMGFKSEVLEMINSLQPNNKGEFDMMDIVRKCHSENSLEYYFIKGKWLDMGVSFDTLLNASVLARDRGLNKY